ncbi:MAG TPA: hypothetical protein PKN87_06780 [Syntrophomonadaceae bacterium]|nr:hypothetical protein [Syntrophomonadaceae bacterium]HPR92811.1 hypothetical protein [Syntrophomonadaceae bacterium]
MGKPFFGGNKEANHKTEPANNEFQLQIEALQAEIKQAREKLKAAESKMVELQNKLDEYHSSEIQIAEVMINAQISAQRIEAQARAQAEILQQQTDEELRRRNQELELLRIKVQLFKQDISERIDHYKSSLERTFDPDEEAAFTPTLVPKDKKTEQKLIG